MTNVINFLTVLAILDWHILDRGGLLEPVWKLRRSELEKGGRGPGKVFPVKKALG